MSANTDKPFAPARLLSSKARNSAGFLAHFEFFVSSAQSLYRSYSFFRSSTRKSKLHSSAKGLSKNILARNAEGMTIVELTIVITLMAIISVSFMTIFTSFITTTTRQNLEIEMTNDSQNLLRTMVEELRYGAGVRQTNAIADANAPGGGWNTSDTNFVIITAVPALDSSNQYIIDDSTGKPYLNEFVYYRQGKLLYKRTLANPSATGNRSITSCPPALADSSCPADRKLVEGLSSINFSLYNQDNGSTTNPLLARSIKIDLTLSRDTFGNPVTFDNSIRVTLRNTF